VSEHSSARDWRLEAACRDGVDPELPFMRKDAPELREFIDEYCGPCPVSAQCLDFALRIESSLAPGMGRHGVFGGFTGDERSALVKRGVRSCALCGQPFIPFHANHRRCGRHAGPSVTADMEREHGSERGYGQHRRRGEDPCLPCRVARNAADRERQSMARRAVA
jgi:hypothetical protein